MAAASKFLMLLSSPFPRLCPRSPLFRLVRRPHVLLAAPFAILGAQHPVHSSGAHRWHAFPPRAAGMHTQAGVRVDSSELSVAVPSHGVAFHPWPEWLKLVEHLTARGYADRRMAAAQGGVDDDDSFSVPGELPEDFRKAAGACLLYARERPDLLRSLSKKDIEVVVKNGSPFLFKNALNSVRRMKSFICSGNDVVQSEQAHTVDVMRYLLSYACNSLTSTGGDDTRFREHVESSVRNLLCDLVKITECVQESNISGPTAQHASFLYEQSSKPLRQNIEMKRGDWICPKCSFMNFSRNNKCLECNEARPKRQLTGGDWECPQCDFFNYERNMTCLRCDCKRPGEISSSRKPSIGQLLNSGNTDGAEIERLLAENDEKAERWFSKVSQLDDSSDLSSAIADEDFPEIMPLRKGTNRFVISTRKTPLERRLANAQYRRNLANEGSHMGNDSMGRVGSDKMPESTISQTLDRILGRSTAAAGTNSAAVSGTSKDTINQSVSGESSATGSGFTSQERSDSSYTPFVPFPADMYRKPASLELRQTSDKVDFTSVKADQMSDTLPGGPGMAKANESLHSQNFNNVTRSETISMREEEKRFVINNEKDHSVTSPHYKRRIAMDQANNSNFVPFVPFPPNYFAKKDKQPEAGSSTQKSVVGPSPSASVGSDKSLTQKFEENKIGYSRQAGSPTTSRDGWNNMGSASGAFSQGVTACGVSASSNFNRQAENPQKTTENWNHGFPGKSLEGSAVTEPDPLDMSEEAKAQRWFRRVAQIKDISELSQIPDEDFPEIMPMRKGVNRFVVSKRKTPLERRLTSPQYRRSLPIMSSEPGKDSTRE